MSGPLRSKQGCWTCRLRKKKYDEAHPNCVACVSLSITCYGYGPKPEWMDNGEAEKAMADSFKATVKITSRRKDEGFWKRHDQVVKIASKASHGSTTNSSSELESSETRTHLSEFPSFLNAEDSTLLMLFLDHIFPLQFPFYQPDIFEGGRGWLLSLLLRTKPLYHAALALAAFHKRMILSGSLDHTSLVAALIEQEKYLEICIRLMNQPTEGSCPSNGLDTLDVPGIDILLFKLFTGHLNAWQAHLGAALNMYQRGHAMELRNFGLADRSRTILFEHLPLTHEEANVREEAVNFRFLGATLIWLDILSSITAGTAPRLFHLHPRAFAIHSQIQLSSVVGCQNWVAQQIGRIAALHARRMESSQSERDSSPELREMVADISKMILRGLAHDDYFVILEADSAIKSNLAANPVKLITHAFAYVASLYLHMVCWGFQALQSIDKTYAGAMKIFRQHVPTQVLPAMVAPLFLFGAVAKEEDKDFFRNAFSSPPVLGPSLKHRERILPILEKIWHTRVSSADLTWKDCLGLAQNILLV
ncbi:hypothetical protein EJ08DRAFT_592791 [Tothia fuscella]|uniref:Zn(2)-C6 fungal-type domain-containing protein n=1 Tax=Tothia fuscella TaxID=1048955 RepID=A0A9P4NLV7_9PEZI|nr:hypothetical protein EJ08DRAFT_592791 [Tothia fuscella]